MKDRILFSGLFFSIIFLFSCGFFSNNTAVDPSKTEYSYLDKKETPCFDIIPNQSLTEFQKEERSEFRERIRRRIPACPFILKISFDTGNFSGTISEPFIYHEITKYTYLFYSSVKATAPPRLS